MTVAEDSQNRYTCGMKKINVAINGLGRIGRAFFRTASKHPGINIGAVNDLGDRDNLEYLLKYDSVYGKGDYALGEVRYLSEKEPANLPWKELAIDIVIESTGFFATPEGAGQHLLAGAKR